MDIGPGDEVIVPSYTFIASIGSIVYSGATPVLAEVDRSLTLDPKDVEARITERTRAIMAVHMLGAPCDMDALMAIANRHDLAIIEDTAQACGATYRGQSLGTIGDIGTFSLNPFKVITSGEGGLVLTGDEELYKRAYAFQDQGWSPLRADRDDTDGHVMFGLNLRMAELAAAVGTAQLDKLETVLNQVRSAKLRLADLIDDIPGLSRRILHDTEGECGTLLIYQLDDIGAAKDLATTLGSKTMIESGRHYYGNMPQLAGSQTPAPLPSGVHQVMMLPTTEPAACRKPTTCWRAVSPCQSESRTATWAPGSVSRPEVRQTRSPTSPRSSTKRLRRFWADRTWPAHARPAGRAWAAHPRNERDSARTVRPSSRRRAAAVPSRSDAGHPRAQARQSLPRPTRSRRELVITYKHGHYEGERAVTFRSHWGQAQNRLSSTAERMRHLRLDGHEVQSHAERASRATTWHRPELAARSTTGTMIARTTRLLSARSSRAQAARIAPQRATAITTGSTSTSSHRRASTPSISAWVRGPASNNKATSCVRAARLLGGAISVRSPGGSRG